jgi:hypothetical protein
VTDFITRLGDRVNPIVVKEMRQAVNSRFVSWSVILFLVVELFAMAIILFDHQARSNSDVLNTRTGREVFIFLQGILMVSCILLIPALTGIRLASERSDVNVDLLFISSLSPRAIMAGKLIAATALALLIFSACAPFMTFAYLLRGLDIPTIAVVLISDFFVVLYGTMFALLLASIPATRGLRIILGLLGVIWLGFVSVHAQEASAGFLEFEFGYDIQSWDFWLGFIGVIVAIIGLIGLMFVWATALISPPTSNRAFLVRLYTLGFWLLNAVVCAIWALEERLPYPMYLWGTIGAVLFAFQILIATSERDSLGPRVLRRIPRSMLLRIPALLFFSGAAGGLIFGALGCAASILGMFLWTEIVHSASIRRWDDDLFKFAVLFSMYSYCYCMSAVAVRRMLYHTQFKSSITWLIAMILFGLGCILPYIAKGVLYPKRYGYSDDILWLFLPSAPIIIHAELEAGRSNFDLSLPFLLIWGLAVTVTNLTWIIRQVVSFRPPAEKVLE